MVGCVSRAKNFLTHYNYFDLRKTEDAGKAASLKLDSYTQKTWNIVKHDCKTLGKTFADIWLYTFVVVPIRSMGICCPPEPQPPTFPSPHDDAEYFKYTIERALWGWQETKSKEIRENISLLDAGIFPVLAQWSLAYFYENLEKIKANPENPDLRKANQWTDIYPTFLNQAAVDGSSSVRDAFLALKPKDKKIILKALYRQEEAQGLSAAGKKSYEAIRALAYKLAQGNKNFTAAFQEYAQSIEEEEAQAPAQGVSASSGSQTTAPSRTTASAPAQTPNLMNAEREMTHDVAFLRYSLLEAIHSLIPPNQQKIIHTIKTDQSAVPSLPRSQVVSANPPTSMKFFVARLATVQFFKDTFWEPKLKGTPLFFNWNTTLSENAKSIREVGHDFSRLQSRDIKTLIQAILYPEGFSKLNSSLQRLLLEINEFAAKVCKNPDFLKTYNALRIDLSAS